MNYSISVKELCKCYGDIQALVNVCFQVEQGEIFAFLGPNGAGKSTTIAILSTLCDFDSGYVCVEGYCRPRQDARICTKLGVVFQGSMLDATLSVKENLLYRSGLYGLFGKKAKERVMDIIGQYNLETIQKQKVKELSGGERRRVDIARAMIPNPQLLILDEPSTGLDPQARKELWQMLQKIHREQSMTVFMTTHYMEEAEIASHIAILRHGSIILDGKKDALVKQNQKDHLHLYSSSLTSIAKVLKQRHIPCVVGETYVTVEIDNFFQLMSLLRNTEVYVHHIELIKGSMEELYLNALRGEEV